MQVFRVVARDKGSPVELDRCTACGALWFDVKELERAAGRPYLARLRGNAAVSKCPACGGGMTDTLVGGELTLEECDSCGGALLDAEGIRPLTGEALVEAKPPPSPSAAKSKPKPAAAKAPPPRKPASPAKDFFTKVVTFDCGRCGKTVKSDQGVTMSGKRVCFDCVNTYWPTQRFSSSRSDTDLVDFLDAVFNTLF